MFFSKIQDHEYTVTHPVILRCVTIIVIRILYDAKQKNRAYINETVLMIIIALCFLSQSCATIFLRRTIFLLCLQVLSDDCTFFPNQIIL